MEPGAVMAGVKECHHNSENDEMKTEMIDRIAETDAHFRHQQRGEPDLRHEEKATIALEILNKSPAKFLERFSKFLTKEDVSYFENMKGDYVVDFYLEEIYKRIDKRDKNTVKNRRYQAMEELMDGGEYFSENEMKWRNPLLFEQMVGQYETIAEQDAREINKKDLKFSSILLNHLVDADATKKLYDRMKETEECQEEEEDESSEDEDMEKREVVEKGENEESNIENDEMDKDREIEDDESKISDVEKGYLKGEFLKIMQERFLAGADTDFDYSAVDSNADYDALDILDHDAEEKYFDDDDTDFRLSQESQNDSDNSCKPMQGSDTRGRIQPGEKELEIRSGLKGMGLTEKIKDEDVEDYMTYEPSVELIETVKHNVYGEG